MEEIKRKLEEAIEESFGIKQEVILAIPPAETGADYATNVAMQLAKLVHKAPIVIAEELASRISSLEPASDGVDTFAVEVAAPGFMNFKMGGDYFWKSAEGLPERIRQKGKGYRGKMVVTEFSDPNPFKVLHVGHFYTSVVGDSISRLIEWDGGEVRRVNFGGDVGLHVGKTLWALLAGLSSQRISSQDLSIEEIAECYVAGTAAYEDDEVAKAEIVKLNKIVYALAELGEEKSHERLELEKIAEDFEVSTAEVLKVAELYWRGRKISYEYFKKFYAEIGIKFDKFYPESSVTGRGLKEVREHVGTTYEESDGAIVYHGEKVGLHTRVFINAQGVPTYEAKDVGLIFTKYDDWHFDESVVVTGNEQTDYMKVVLASVSEYAPKMVERTTHLTHGLVKLPGNVKMSSRKGNFLKAVDVLQLVEDQLQYNVAGNGIADNEQTSLSEDALLAYRMSNTARSVIPSSSNSTHSKQSLDLVDSDQHKILLAAIKYAFLKYKMGGDIIFDPAESVATNGNSGVYLLYSAVRAKKILAKSAEGEVEGDGVADLSDNTFVRELSKKIVQYEGVLSEAAREKAPHKICTFLYELAQEFSRFYENVKVAGSEYESELVKLVKTYLYVVEHGLGILGIEIPEEM